MLELHISDNNITTGNLAITWCLSKEDLEELSKRDCTDPVIVLCTAPVDDNYSIKKEYRTIVSLKDLVGYVQFYSAGPNKIWAFIIDNKKRAKDFYLRKDYDGWISWILNSTGNDYVENVYVKTDSLFVLAALPILVEVPKEAFAKEPSSWEKTWVNLLFEEKLLDQCSFRRKRLFAYTIQPLLMLINIFFRFIFALISLLYGSKKFSLQPLLHPIQYDFTDALNVLDSETIFINNKYLSSEKLNLFKAFAFLPLMPLILVNLYISYIFHFFIWAIALFLAVAIFLIGFQIVFTLSCFFSEKKPANKTVLPWYLEEEDVIVCNGRKSTKLSDLPAKHRTVKLRFQELKSKICRPYSR